MTQIELKNALNLTRQGKLREAVDVLRAKLSQRGPTAAPVTEVLQNALGQLPFRRPPAPAPGGSTFENYSFANPAGKRDYRLFVPSTYHGQAMPLVVMLHGCTQSATDFAVGTGMNELAEEMGFLVAYPKQDRKANFSKCWNWFNTANQQRDAGEPSIIAGITRQVMRDFAVDGARVFVAGMSAGGAQAMVMGTAYPELYAAVGVHSGLACGAAHDMGSGMAAMRGGAQGKVEVFKKPVPAIVFHGDKDHTVNVLNAAQVAEQAAGGENLGTQVMEGESAGGVRYTRTVRTARGRPMLELWVLHGAGHAWAGGHAEGSYTDPKGPDASREMVRFFWAQK